MKKILLIFTFGVIIIGGIIISIYISSLPVAKQSNDLQQISGSLNTSGNNSNLVCKDDIYFCNNGGYVSRDPKNNCQFDCEKAITPINGIIVCPSDVKQCDDGSFVIRDPNNKCEFKICK